MRIPPVTDADLQKYLQTPLVALYGFDTDAKQGLLSLLSSKLGAAYLGQQPDTTLVTETSHPVMLPPPVFDPLGSYSHPTWEKRMMSIPEVFIWWSERRDDRRHTEALSGSAAPYFYRLVATGVANQVVAIEHLERNLHPQYISMLTDFLVSLVRNGQRVLFETHSLQVFDRLRMWDAWDPHLEGKFGVWAVDRDGNGSPVQLHTDGHFPNAMTDNSLEDEIRIGQLRKGEA